MDNNNFNILIADDIPANLSLLSGLLKKEGYNVLIATSGDKAIDLTKIHQPDLLLLDIMMPIVTGLDVCKILKSDPQTQNIPIIFVTSKQEQDELIKGFELGASDYITKPYNHKELLLRVKNHLELKQAKILISQMANKLQMQSNELMISNNKKDKFFSILANDMLIPMEGFVKQVKNLHKIETFPEDTELQKVTVELIKYFDEFSTLLNNMVNWGYSQSILTKFEVKNQNLHEIAQFVISKLEDKIQSKNVLILNNIPENLPVISDWYALQIILICLLSNAIKFSFPNSFVTLSANVNENFVEILIEDQGVGISQEMLDNLFDINNIKSNLGTNGEKGSGLGLIIAKELVDKLAGSINIIPKEGSGTIVSIKLFIY